MVFSVLKISPRFLMIKLLVQYSLYIIPFKFVKQNVINLKEC